jgi:hypothetical protein
MVIEDYKESNRREEIIQIEQTKQTKVVSICLAVAFTVLCISCATYCTMTDIPKEKVLKLQPPSP